jgi:hypothetical protein
MQKKSGSDCRKHTYDPGSISMKWKLAIGIASLMAAQAAFAGGSYLGMVKPVHYGSLYLLVSGTQMSGRPACATRAYVRLQEDPSSSVYREKFAMILSAWMAEKPIALYGTGNCTSEGDEIIYVVSYP